MYPNKSNHDNDAYGHYCNDYDIDLAVNFCVCGGQAERSDREWDAFALKGIRQNRKTKIH